VKRAAVALLASVALLAACEQPLPAERLAYTGEWKSLTGDESMSLVIYAGGRVVYERKTGNRSTRIDAPLKEFKGDSFLVGVGFMNTEFVVTKPPHEEGGLWKMTVDGVELTRVSGQDLQIENPDSTST